MNQAYNVHSILKEGVQIESIAAYGNHVILGTRSGQLIMYSVDENAAVDMVMFNKNFSKKAITQMKVVAEENLLFVLTDSMIHVCDISRIEINFAFIHSSAQTKGCSLFAVDVKTKKSTSGVSATVIRICCAIKRRLEFYYWKPNKLVAPSCSIDLKDVPKALCFVDDFVCVGYKDEYVLFDISAKQPIKHDLIVTSSSHSVDPCICPLRKNILGVSKDEFLVPIDTKVYEKKNDSSKNGDKEAAEAVAAVARVATKNVLQPLCWPSLLLGIVWDEPYVIGRVANSIQVRSFVTHGANKDTLIQTIPELCKIKFLVRSHKGIIFAAGTSELWCIRMVDIPTQRHQLLQKKMFQLAIELSQVSDEPDEMRLETIRQIHMRYARELFDNKQFSAAMKEFEKGAADPYDVIRLFPNLLPDQKPQSEYASVPPVSASQLEDKELECALMALIEFLALARQKEVVKLRDTKSTSKSLLSIIDTTLLKCYLQTNDSVVAPLLRLNQCHLEESEKMLKKYEKISELIILYQTNGKHKKALELLRAQANVEGSSLYGHERTVRYLQELGSSHLPLIFEFADWVLAKHPEDGFRIFTQNLIEVECLPRANVLDFLISKHKSMVIQYLEHIINEWGDTNTLIHNVLAKQYREKVQQLMQDCGDGDSTETLKKYRNKLYDFLQNSTNYSPDVVLQDFPTNMLFEERALLLGRLKKHEKVLAVYVQILGDVDKATSYCEANYDDDNDIFVKLLKIILSPLQQPPYEGVKMHPEFVKPNEDIALEILNKYAVKIDPSEVFLYLPDDMKLYRLKAYLDKALRTQIAQSNHLHIMEGLLKAEIMRLEAAIHEEENKSFEISEFSVCPECKKRFANQSAFVRYPNGEVVHLSCYDRRAQSAQLTL